MARRHAPSAGPRAVAQLPVVILAGGRGTRLSEETVVRPKPMVEVGGRPIVWHIMRYYAAFGFREFILALGYKGEEIKRYFLHYRELNSSLTVRLKDGAVRLLDSELEDWTVHLIDTGPRTETGGRLKRLAPWIGRRPCLMTYGDGVADVDVRRLLAFHRQQGRLATVTAVRPPARFGGLLFKGEAVREFTEKPQIGEGWINGGFFVLEPRVFDYLKGDDTVFERDPLERLARDGELSAYRHDGFWHCVDSRRDLELLEQYWAQGAPWKVW